MDRDDQVARAVAQLDLLRRMSELDPPPFVFGGYAEDALLAGTVTRPHGDVDWLVPRNELALRLEQARTLGFVEFETWGESAPGEPFYLFAQSGDLSIDIGVADEADGRPLARVWKLAFPIDGGELDGIAVHVASPLALHQIRAAIAAKGSFGPLSATQRASLDKLRETFFPEYAEHELTPRIESLPAG
jgi:hypothetical protein